MFYKKAETVAWLLNILKKGEVWRVRKILREKSVFLNGRFKRVEG